MNKKVDFKGSVILNPVPVVLITSKNKEGKENVFTVAWTGTVCTKPPMLSISVRPERLSYEYIKETMEFTVNLPTSKMTKAVDYCGVRPGRKFDKIKEMNFTMKEGTNINVPYIDECPISIECKVKSIIPLGTHDLLIADVVGSHVDSNLMDEKGKIHFEEADLITYCHGEYFKMDKYPLGKFGYSIAKKPITVKDSTKSIEKENDTSTTKAKDLSKHKPHNKNNNYNSSNVSKKRNSNSNKTKNSKKNTASSRKKTK